MTIHPAFIRPATRPALAPILFPIDSMDQMLWELKTAKHLHDDNAHIIPAHIIKHQLAWCFRLDARKDRIAQVVS